MSNKINSVGLNETIGFMGDRGYPYSFDSLHFIDNIIIFLICSLVYLVVCS